MKEGRIAHQGTLQDIVDETPDLYNEYQQAVKTATESETELEETLRGLSEDEREMVFRKQISRELSRESGENGIWYAFDQTRHFKTKNQQCDICSLYE